MAKVSMLDTIQDSFEQYAGAVLQSRALPDVRDCVKPSARQILYANYTDGFIHDKPFKKTIKAIASSLRFYIHGDSSVEGILMRFSEPFALRYPLIEVEGNGGTQIAPGTWAAPRYTSSRLSPIAEELIKDTNEHTIEEWTDNYDDTEKYPSVLSSLGFYNIVNGSTGIGLGLASSVPSFNLKEVNAALVKLIENPDSKFEDIICYPDYPTGGTIINKDEIVDSLKNGKGKAAKVRATMDYDKKDNCLIVRDLPYSVYSNTICSEIEKLYQEDSQYIKNINDLTGQNVCIKIYLNKKINPDAAKEYLYANTSLQKSISINMTMLDNGRYPKVFGLKEAFLKHLDFEKKTYISYFNYELEKSKTRYEIIKGIIFAILNIDKTIEIVKGASSNREAIDGLIAAGISSTEAQAKAVLDIKLSRLTRMDTNKLKDEGHQLKEKIGRIEDILNDGEKLKQVMIKRLQEVSDKYGDERRTKLDNVEVKTIAKGKKNEPIDVMIVLDSLGYIKTVSVKEYRNRKDDKTHFKTSTDGMVLLFSNYGRFFRIKVGDIKMCGNTEKGIGCGALVDLEPQEKILNIFDMSINSKKPYLTNITANGIIKKSKKEVYVGTTQNKKGQKGINLKDGDEIVNIFESNGDYITIYTSDGYELSFNLDEISPTGKAAKGRKAIKLHEQYNAKVYKVKVSSTKPRVISKVASVGIRSK